ncbi:MAG TPA: hypothetical protein VFS44_00255 [Gemmatimonadaceae bacterium]|nr:hypothetical protein [Gemmatimonadaceae bacterium]
MTTPSNTSSTHRLMLLLAYPVAIAMLVFWAVMTFAFSGPGWVHLFLSLGMFLLIWRVAAGGTEESWRRHLQRRR